MDLHEPVGVTCIAMIVWARNIQAMVQSANTRIGGSRSCRETPLFAASIGRRALTRMRGERDWAGMDE